ncbi:MAG: LysR substrate-binding domain-containing protein [Geminicoccaceae bacterium]|jgi:DNA-binding transcriptional LysR family regulator
MDQLQAMRAFVAVADSGSFIGGARSLALSAPTVTRAVAELETRLGARLVNRTTRSLSLTEAGLRFLISTRRLLADLEEAERSAAGATATPSGHLRVTAPLTFGRSHVMPVLAAFLREQPRVTATLVTLDRVVGLIDEGFDLAVRIASLPDSTLVARRIGEVRRLLVASPAYLQRRGAPNHPRDMAQHEVIGSEFMFPGGEWRFTDGERPQALCVASRLTVNDALAAIMAAERGDGIAGALSYMVAPQRAAGTLVALLEPFTPAAVPVHLVFPQSRLLAAKVRAFVDFTAPRLMQALAEAG